MHTRPRSFRASAYAVSAAAVSIAGPASAGVVAPVYLNDANITVAVGPGTSPGTFNNTFDGGQTIGKVIDAPSADAEEFHNQTTHIYFTATDVGGGLELVFDFGQAYDITTLHFWNYTSEGFDVDQIDFTFANAADVEVGTLLVEPDLGSLPGIAAQDIALAAPLNISRVTAFLTGSNRQIDFQNIGFTANESIPEPATAALLAAGVLLLARRRRA